MIFSPPRFILCCVAFLVCKSLCGPRVPTSFLMALKDESCYSEECHPFRDSDDELFPVLFQKSRERSSRSSRHLPSSQMEVIHSSQRVLGERVPDMVIQMTLVIFLWQRGLGEEVVLITNLIQGSSVGVTQMVN